MKRTKHRARKIRWNWVMWVCIFFLWSGNALGAEESGNWRTTYDTVMMWVNFFILAFLIVKFAGPLLKKFLNDQQNEVALEIERLEKQRNQLIQKVEQTVQGMEHSRAHFKTVKEKILAQGEAEKQKIVKEAGRQSRAMLDDAMRRVENQILAAKKDFRSELIDSAVDLAMKDIGGYMKPEDNERLLDQFLAAAG